MTGLPFTKYVLKFGPLEFFLLSHLMEMSDRYHMSRVAIGGRRRDSHDSDVNIATFAKGK